MFLLYQFNDMTWQTHFTLEDYLQDADTAIFA